MKKEIIINSTVNESRVAITEDGRLAEYFIESPENERIVGNVYLGKVTNIIPGINAAFVDIGMKTDAFLHFSDVDESLENNFFVEEDEDDSDSNNSPETSSKDLVLRKSKAVNNNLIKYSTKKSGDVLINLSPGQEVIVQVTREAYSTKGVKVTSRVAIPGRYMVLLPFETILGVSRKISDYGERKRLRQTARHFIPNDFGCILRTATRGKDEEELRKDWNNLMGLWQLIESRVHNSHGEPTLLYQDLQLTGSVIRDLFTPQVERVIVDSRKLYKEITTYLTASSPHLLDKIELYKGNISIFENFGLEREISSTYKRKVHLKSGASIVIDQTEAMIVVDVNSGRAVENDQEKTALVINLDALKEIAKQIRLRDIAGIILIDFIDMQQEANRKKLYNEMKRELYKDRAKSVVYPVTQLGLMQITRQRINQNIAEKISEPCPTCNGSGRIANKSSVLNEIDDWIFSFRNNSQEFRLQLVVHPKIAEYLTEGEVSLLSKLMMKHFVKIKLLQSDNLPFGHFQVFSLKQNKDITKEYL